MTLAMWLARPVGVEARKVYWQRLAGGFFERYLSGAHILDIGYRGGRAQAVPIVPQAIGVDLDYPGYDGTTLHLADNDYAYDYERRSSGAPEGPVRLSW